MRVGIDGPCFRGAMFCTTQSVIEANECCWTASQSSLVLYIDRYTASGAGVCCLGLEVLPRTSLMRLVDKTCDRLGLDCPTSLSGLPTTTKRCYGTNQYAVGVSQKINGRLQVNLPSRQHGRSAHSDREGIARGPP